MLGITDESSFCHIYRDYQPSKMKIRDSTKLDAPTLVHVKQLQEKVFALLTHGLSSTSVSKQKYRP